ncbi:MAG: HEAT repeat domain-containing protein [Planctomycetes bacterium]|nr:HEAT repeat domain-containing protein [Planctomycetota bacterium]
MLRSLVLVLSLCGSVATAGDIFNSPTLADVPALIRSFEDSNIRLGASKAIVAIGEPAIPQLSDALRSDQLDVQIWSAYTIGKIGPSASAAAPALASLLHSADSNLRAVSARSLGQIHSDNANAIALLAKSITDDDSRVRRSSVISLGQIGTTAGLAVPQLVDALDDQPVCADVIRSLVQIGEDAIPRLTEALANDSVRLEAAEVLRQLDPAAAKQLGIEETTKADLNALRMSIHDVDRGIPSRTSAAERLGKLGLDAAPVLIAAFADNANEVVRASSAAFQAIGPAAVPLLREALKHESGRVRAAAIDALAAIGSDANNALPDLMTSLTDADREVRHRAVKTLSVFGSASEPAIPALIAVMHNPRDLEATRQLAVKTLARIATPEHEQIINALRESTKDTNYGVSSLAKQMLKTLETSAGQSP